MVSDTPTFTTVTLLTGFLGSGKTTLLRLLLSDPALADTAVLINEFGEVGLDHHLLERIDERTVLLKSGCLCCTVRGELADAVKDLHSRRARGVIPGFRRLVIESTGLADPFPVLTTIHADPVLKHHYRMGGVVTTVDAVNVARTLSTFAESVKQIAVADIIVLTKRDLVGADAAGAAMRRVRAINPAARLIQADNDDDLAPLLAGNAAPRRSADTEHWIADEFSAAVANHEPGDGGGHDRGIRAFALTFDQPLDWTAFGLWLTMLLHRHGAAVLRMKGILNVDGEAAPVAVHGVQHLVHAPTHLQAWPDADRRSRIVFIVRDLEPAEIERSLTVFCHLDLAPATA
jgi:G3E family GTPase